MTLVDELLRRIGLDARPAADVAGLHAVHRAYLERIPYEALAVQLGESGVLDDEASAARIVAGRGGYCFEMNGALGLLLAGLGFPVEHHQAKVGPRDEDAPTNHRVLLVDAGGERWIADAGLGEGFLDPLPLREGTHASGPFAWTIEREPDGGWWVAQHAWGSFAGFRIRPEIATLDDFRPHHARLSTDPESSFVQTLVVQRPLADRIVTLRARTLTAKGPEVDESRVLASRDELERTLRDVFGIAVLDEARLTQLWEQASTQHEAYLAREAAG